MTNSPVLDAIDKIGDTFLKFKDANDERLSNIQGRIESLESLGDRPRLAGSENRQTAYKRFETSHGAVFELPHNVKMADVPELAPAKPPEISLERWLGATVAGDRSGDAEAVKFVREEKQMVTTSTGVLIPAQYISQWIDLIARKVC
jgi:hypothetical protein